MENNNTITDWDKSIKLYNRMGCIMRAICSGKHDCVVDLVAEYRRLAIERAKLKVED